MSICIPWSSLPFSGLSGVFSSLCRFSVLFLAGVGLSFGVGFPSWGLYLVFFCSIDAWLCDAIARVALLVASPVGGCLSVAWGCAPGALLVWRLCTHGAYVPFASARLLGDLCRLVSFKERVLRFSESKKLHRGLRRVFGGNLGKK